MMPLRALAIFIATLSTLTGCAQSGRVVDGAGTVYSEYIQCLIYSEDRTLSFDALITLGTERLPEVYELSESQSRYLSTPDTILSVSEVYLKSHSEEPIQVSGLEILEGIGSFTRKYNPEIFDIPPKSFVKSEPIVDVTSIFRPTTIPCRIEFVRAGKRESLNGAWRRLTVDELSR
jgi:hypothetical protein